MTSVLQFFVLAMILHPEIQARAQAEIDKVVKGRLPGFQDEKDLPYTSAIVLECVRWGVHASISKWRSHLFLLHIPNMGSIAVPHRVMQDDHYRGYFIPAGATVHLNLWCVLVSSLRSFVPSIRLVLLQGHVARRFNIPKPRHVRPRAVLLSQGAGPSGSLFRFRKTRLPWYLPGFARRVHCRQLVPLGVSHPTSSRR
jgi:hypothetical protein